MVRAAAWMTGLVPDAVERQVRGGFLYGDHLSLCGQRPRQRGCCSACKLRSDPQKPGGGSRKSSALEGKEAGETQLKRAAVRCTICRGSVSGQELLAQRGAW